MKAKKRPGYGGATPRARYSPPERRAPNVKPKLGKKPKPGSMPKPKPANVQKLK